MDAIAQPHVEHVLCTRETCGFGTVSICGKHVFSACIFHIHFIFHDVSHHEGFHSPAQLKFSSHTDHICTVKNGAQQMIYARTMTKVILTVRNFALEIVVTLLTEFFPISPFLCAPSLGVFLVLYLMFILMLWHMNP